MKWFCDDCVPVSTALRGNPCPACCGFTAMNDDMRGEIGAAVARMAADPILDIARASNPELAASLDLLERVAAGEAS